MVLTKIETKLLNELTEDERTFFENHFSKVSPLKWVTDLKHYVETYSFLDALIINEINFNVAKIIKNNKLRKKD
jgi:hypothetical protein